MLMWRSGPCCSSAIARPSIATMRIVVVAVGKVRPPFADDVDHYAHLLSAHTRLELVEVREDERVERRIPERAFVSLLAMDGQALDSVRLSRFLEDRRMSGRDLCFVVGGPFGLELDRADHRLSLGPLTLPHQLARVVLLEQLFRAHKILAGEPYHH
jgi:23S rRNA (pseudouridine1915-N3)-methyltransferase